MGLLLMQYEYQKAKMKSNLLQLQGIRLNDKHEMYTKRLGNIEKMFTKKKSSIESLFNAKTRDVQSAMTAARNATSSSAFSAQLMALGGFNIVTQYNDQMLGITETDTSSNAYKNQVSSGIATAASQIQNYITTLLETLKQQQLEELEMLEDAQREPIADKDSEIQAEIAQNEVLSEIAKQREEAAKAKLPDVAKNSVAHYGLS